MADFTWSQEEIDQKLEYFARWLNDHPRSWNFWPFGLPPIKDKIALLSSYYAVRDRIMDHQFDAFRVDTQLLEMKLVYLAAPINVFGIAMRLKA